MSWKPGILVLMPVQLLPGWLTQDTHHACSRPVSLAVRSVSHSPCLTVVGKAALLAGTSVPRGTGCNLLSEPSTWAAQNAVPVVPAGGSATASTGLNGGDQTCGRPQSPCPWEPGQGRVLCASSLSLLAGTPAPTLLRALLPIASPSPADPGRQVL